MLDLIASQKRSMGLASIKHNISDNYHKRLNKKHEVDLISLEAF